MDSSKKVCDFYSKNNSCRFGDQCKHLHIANIVSPQLAVPKPESSKKRSRGKPAGGKVVNTQTKATNTNSSKNQGNQGKNQTKSPVPSTPAPTISATISKPIPEPSPAWDTPVYSTSGAQPSVTNGRDLVHEETPRPSPSSIRSPQGELTKTNKICSQYKKGSCWKGNKCPNIHDISAVAPSPAPSTLSELVMSPRVDFNKFNVNSGPDRKGKAPIRGSETGNNKTNGNATPTGTAARSAPAPSPAPSFAPIPPPTPSFQFKPVNSSWSYDSDEEEEFILGTRKTPKLATPSFINPSPWTPSPEIPAPRPEETEIEHGPSPASTQSTPIQQTFELGEEAVTPDGGVFEVDFPRDEAGPVVYSVDPILSQIGNGHAFEQDLAGKDNDPVQGQQLSGPRPSSPFSPASPVPEEVGQPAEDVEDKVNEIDAAKHVEEEKHDVNYLGKSSGFDWSSEVEENGEFSDAVDNSTLVVAVNDADVEPYATPSTTFDDEIEVITPSTTLTSLNTKPSAALEDSWNVNDVIEGSTESEHETKLDFEGENPPLEVVEDLDTCVPDEHEIDQQDTAESENEAEQHEQQSRTQSPRSSKTSPPTPFHQPFIVQPEHFTVSPPSSSSHSSLVSPHIRNIDISPKSTPLIPILSPPPAIADMLDSPAIPFANPPINSARVHPRPQIAMSPETTQGLAQPADPVEATAANVNQLQVAGSTQQVLPPGLSASAAVPQPVIIPQTFNPAFQQQLQLQLQHQLQLQQQQQVAYQMPQQQQQVLQQPQSQVNHPAFFAPPSPFNLQYPLLQMPQYPYQPLVTPVMMQPIIQQPAIIQQPPIYVQSNPMYNPPLNPYSQSFTQHQQQQQQQTPHWTQFADPQARSDLPFCKLLAQGACPAGNACANRHALTIHEFTLLFHDRQPALISVGQTHPWHAQALPRIPNAPTVVPQVVNYSQSYSHTATQSIAAVNQAPAQPAAPAQQPKPQVCSFFPLNRCNNGDNCPYLHVQPDAQQATSSNSRPNSNWGKAGPSNSRSRVPCKFYFSTSGTCENTRCTFSHDQSDAPSVNNPPDFQEDPAKEKPEETVKDSGWGEKTDWAAAGWGVGAAGDETKAADLEAWGSGSATKDSKPARSSTNKVVKAPKSPKSEYVNGKKRCHHYQRGSCWKGDNCRFFHGSDNGESSNSADPPQAGYRTPRSQTSSELRKPSIVDFDSAKRDANLDNFGQAATLGGKNKEEAGVDPWGESSGVKLSEYDEEKTEKNNVEEKTNEPNGGWGEDVEDGNKEEEEEEEEDGEEDGEEEEEEPEEVDDLNEDVVDDELSESDEEPIIFQHPEKSFNLYNSVVRFHPDITPDDITTSAESRTIIISNLPRRVPIPDVRQLVESYGGVKDVSVSQDFAESTSVQVDYEDVSQAKKAFVGLNNQTFQERQLGVKLKSRSPVTAKMPALRCSVKVTWPLPSITAFSYYPTIAAAKQELARLEGKEIKGRVISTIFDSPHKGKKDNFVLNINDLSPDTTLEDLEGVLSPSKVHVVLNRPSDEGDVQLDVTEEVKLLCHQCGGMDSFEAIPSAPTQKKFTAYVTFTSEHDADQAIRRLHNIPQKLLKDKPLQVRAMYYVRYRIESNRFKVLEAPLKDLQSGNCQLSWDTSDGEGVQLRVLAAGDKGSSFQEVNAAVLALLEGRVVRDGDGQPLWHEYFEMSSNSKLLNRLSTEFPILIYRNEYTRQLKVIGASDIQDQVESRIQKTITKLIPSMTRRFNVTKPQIGALINGLLDKLQDNDSIGPNRLALDAIEGILTIWGNKNNEGAIVIAALKGADVQQYPDGSVKPRSRCQVCGQVSVQPKQLSCRHSYCRSCLTFVIRNTSQTPILCLGKDEYNTRCFSYVPFAMIRELIPSEEKEFLRSCLASYVGRSTDFFFCPTLDCDSIYRTGEPGLVIKCSRCRCDLCPSCKTWSHVGLDCAAVQQHLHPTAGLS